MEDKEIIKAQQEHIKTLNKLIDSQEYYEDALDEMFENTLATIVNILKDNLDKKQWEEIENKFDNYIYTYKKEQEDK